MNATRTLLFDLDGTLTDNYAGITRSIRHALSGLDWPAVDDATLRHCIGPPLRKTFARLLATDDAQRIEHALVLYRERYAVDGWRENEVYAGIDVTLATLAARGHRMLLCTSKPKVYAERIVAHFGLAKYLAAVYGAELGGRVDDKADLMAELLCAEKLVASRCVMVGDRAQDIIAANANGVRPVGVLWGYGSREELQAAGARELLDAPGQLVAAVG